MANLPVRRARNGDILANYTAETNGHAGGTGHDSLPAVSNSVNNLLGTVTQARRGFGILDGLRQDSAVAHAQDIIRHLGWVEDVHEAENSARAVARKGVLERLRDENEALELLKRNDELKSQLMSRGPLTPEKVQFAIKQQDLELDARIGLAHGKARKRSEFQDALEEALVETEVRMRRRRRTQEEIDRELKEVERDFHRSWGYRNGEGQ